MISVILELDLIPGQPEDRLAALASKRYHCDLTLKRILKKSVDARKKDRVVIKYRAVYAVAERDKDRLLRQGAELWTPEKAEKPEPAVRKPRVVIVGTGPAGLFCALRLSEKGVRCTVLEQGKAVSDRHRDIERLRTEGLLDPDSNVVFGEGGAGTGDQLGV